ncbi:universal stress protein [Nonomuraea sp. NPDC051191]|uniref:universal stress protein n=1 Tax=Nonomuraea sp. NPDC051191 TaxID=3364372 RepID=UPI0037A78B20
MSELVVVGVDGSPSGFDAVAWAADDAFRAKGALRIVSVVETWPYQVPQIAAVEWESSMTERAREILAQAEEIVRERRPTVDVSTRVIAGKASVALREQASEAAELVVGRRGTGGFAGAVLGSVSMSVAGQAPGPVVVVRDGGAAAYGEVAVGVDGSPAAEPALAYAFRQAELRGSMLRAVHAWPPPFALAPDFSCDIEALRESHLRITREQLTPWQERHPEVKVVTDVQCGHPVKTLAGAGERADLLIIGSHGRSGLGSAVLGSVMRGVLHHAHCTVAVVRERH